MTTTRRPKTLKRLVVACDGTWNKLDAQHPTNVAKIAQAVMPVCQHGVPQLVYHLDGVGAGRGTGRLARATDRILGGLLGTGLMANLADAYRFLVFNYAPGDEVFLVGFSRGAFTARSLAGLIRNCGIVERRHAAAIPEALALYASRSPDDGPDAANARAFRARHASHVTTSAEDARWRRATLGADGSILLRLRYLGVWDTVGALGIPAHLRFATLLNRGLQFHDTRLSRCVAAARHAVSVDEQRRTFPPTLWDNLEALNDGATGSDRAYRQVWFPGDHGSVGGGGPVTALSDEALLWIAEGAATAGLAFDPAAMSEWTRGRDPMGPLTARGTEPLGLVGRFLRLDMRDREGPQSIDAVGEATRKRWRSDTGYRPKTLARVAAVLDRAAVE